MPFAHTTGWSRRILMGAYVQSLCNFRAVRIIEQNTAALYELVEA